MRRVFSTFGLIVATSSSGCALGSSPHGAAGITQNEAIDVSHQPATDARALTLSAIECILAPAAYQTPLGATRSGPTGTFGPETASCVAAAHAAQIRPLRLYRLDSDATFEVRRAIGRSPLASGAQSEQAIRDLQLLFEKSVGAVAEGRRARAALTQTPVTANARSNDALRSHEMVVALDDFGRSSQGDLATYARAIALVVSANNFLLIGRVPAPERPFAAEPMFSMMFGSEFLSSGPEEPPATWPDYVGAAGNSVESADAVGGGPPEELGPEKESLAKVVHVIKAQLHSFEQRLPAGDLRAAVLHTSELYTAFP